MAKAREGEWFGHPKGLMVLFCTEMWERFSYYGMRALLVLYMVNYFKWTQQDASSVYKWYTSLVYLTPLIGGYLADRYLGNKWAIVIGASSMAIGHFCMAFEQISIFYAALAFLIVGNGFFKPNMSTQVGRLYAAGDPRRDGAYTIFYMGVNLGAFLAPIVCGALAEGTTWSYHAGFAAAGVGMVVGLLTYLFGQRWIRELPPDTLYVDPDREAARKREQSGGHYMTEKEADTTPSVIPAVARLAPGLLVGLGVATIGAAAVLWQYRLTSWDNALALGLGGGVASFMSAWIIGRIRMAARDRVLAILALALFVIFFWAAFEQAGNAMNVVADKMTNRYVTQPEPAPSVFPAEPSAGAGTSLLGQLKEAVGGLVRFNPMSTASFQAINPLAIFVLAPLVAWLWVWLPRRGIVLSIPSKMAIGVFLNGLAFALMIWGGKVENRPTATALDALPAGVWSDASGRVVFRDAPDLGDDAGFAAYASSAGTGAAAVDEPAVVAGGRLRFTPGSKRLELSGVLSDTDRDRMLRATVPGTYLEAVRRLARESVQAGIRAAGAPISVSVPLAEVPPGFDLRYAGSEGRSVRLDPQALTLTATAPLADRDYKMILLAGAEPGFRDALNDLYVNSAKFKMSVWWLVWFYVLCTLGELCLSPVGLSMVSKLAPAKFATMLMGLWYLTSFFGNFAAGLAGESWGTVTPITYFGIITVALVGASLVCFVVTRKIMSMMHGVN